MTTKITIDASGNQVVFNNPGHSASETNNPSDAPAPSRSGSQVTALFYFPSVFHLQRTQNAKKPPIQRVLSFCVGFRS